MPRASSAALCIAGERLCATGSPMTPMTLVRPVMDDISAESARSGRAGRSPAAGTQGGVRRGEAGDRNAVGRARHVVERELMAEDHRCRLAAVLAADPDLELRLLLAPALGADAH